MAILQENREKLIRALATLFFAVSIFYFSYYAISGQKGVISMFRLMRQLEKSKDELDSVKAERIGLERKVDMLYNNSLDADMLDEQARKLLGVAGKDEVIYFIPKDEKEGKEQTH
jgi:cell division protein FtsB